MHVVKWLAAKKLAGVIPEVNLKEHTPLPSANKAAHSGFKTRRDIRSPKWASVAPQKGLMWSKFFFNFIIPTVTPMTGTPTVTMTVTTTVHQKIYQFSLYNTNSNTSSNCESNTNMVCAFNTWVLFKESTRDHAGLSGHVTTCYN